VVVQELAYHQNLILPLPEPLALQILNRHQSRLMLALLLQVRFQSRLRNCLLRLVLENRSPLARNRILPTVC
jgi:hypothetical protein